MRALGFMAYVRNQRASILIIQDTFFTAIGGGVVRG